MTGGCYDRGQSDCTGSRKSLTVKRGRYDGDVQIGLDLMWQVTSCMSWLNRDLQTHFAASHLVWLKHKDCKGVSHVLKVNWYSKKCVKIYVSSNSEYLKPLARTCPNDTRKKLEGYNLRALFVIGQSFYPAWCNWLKVMGMVMATWKKKTCQLICVWFYKP